MSIPSRKGELEATQQTIKFFETLLRASPDGIVITDITQSIIVVNKSFCRLFDCHRREVIETSIYTWLEQLDAGALDRWAEIEKVLREKGSCQDVEFQIKTKDGVRHLSVNASILARVADEETGHIISIWRDVTAYVNQYNQTLQILSRLKKTQKQLVQAQKIEALGTMAGGIAHEFNTLMTTIMGNADLALMSTGKDDPLREGLEDIKSAGEKAADLTRQILAFSRKQMRQPKILDLNEVLVNSEKTLKRLITENVELKTIFGSSLRTVNMDPIQIEQMVVHLVTNAGDAMPTGGTLTIETANVDLDEDFFKNLVEKEQPGSYVMLSVTDTGSGMDAKVQEHMFEPFYTTREVGQGTGLGLSMVYGIVMQNEGVIRVDSDIGRSSTFKIYLPIAKDDPEAEKTDLTREDASKSSGS